MCSFDFVLLLLLLLNNVALADLALTHPIRVGLELNFLVFYYEILHSSGKDCCMAKQVFITLIHSGAFHTYLLLYWYNDSNCCRIKCESYYL